MVNHAGASKTVKSRLPSPGYAGHEEAFDNVAERVPDRFL